jgi:hypothetical protein
MDYGTWILALLMGATIVGSALAYGVLSNRQCDAQLRPTKQDRIDDVLAEGTPGLDFLSRNVGGERK